VSVLRRGSVAAPILGALWMFVVTTSVAVVISFATGEAIRPSLVWSLLYGAVAGLVVIRLPAAWMGVVAALATLVPFAFVGTGPLVMGEGMGVAARMAAAALAAAGALGPLHRILDGVRPGPLTRHEFEDAVIRFLTGLGYVVFTALVLIPFYVMVMTLLISLTPLSAALRVGALRLGSAASLCMVVILLAISLASYFMHAITVSRVLAESLSHMESWSATDQRHYMRYSEIYQDVKAAGSVTGFIRVLLSEAVFLVIIVGVMQQAATGLRNLAGRTPP